MWAGTLPVRLLGTTFALTGDSQEPLDLAEALLGPFVERDARVPPSRTLQLVDERETTRRVHLFRDECLETSATTWQGIVTKLVAVLNREALYRCRPFAVHAGVVAMGERVVAFPAESGDGKSTLVAGLTMAGATYLSDEALVLDRDGTVVPYPKPSALDEWSRRALGLGGGDGEVLFAPGELGPFEIERTSRPSDVVLMERGDEPDLTSLPPSAAIAALLQHSFNQHRNPAEAFRLATTVAATARTWRLTVSDPIETAKLVMDEFSS